MTWNGLYQTWLAVVNKEFAHTVIKSTNSLNCWFYQVLSEKLTEVQTLKNKVKITSLNTIVL